MGTTDGNLPLNKIAVEDAARLCELRPDSAKAREFALQVLEAASRDPKAVERCQAQIRTCLARLLAAGCTRESLEARYSHCHELLLLVPKELERPGQSPSARPRAEEPTIPDLPFPTTASWDDFLRQVSRPPART
jgi:hypothetical protein